MKRRILTALVGIITITFLTSPTTSRARNGYIDQSALFESEEVEFQTMLTTAYKLRGITATGTSTHEGICACNPHVGEVALIYTEDGEFLGSYECCDTGSTNGLINGTVIDVWQPDMDACKAWMLKTGGRVKVCWISGVG